MKKLRLRERYHGYCILCPCLFIVIPYFQSSVLSIHVNKPLSIESCALLADVAAMCHMFYGFASCASAGTWNLFFYHFRIGATPPFVYIFIYFLGQYYCLLHFGVKASRASTSALTYYPWKKCQGNSTPLTDWKLWMILTTAPRQPLVAPDVTDTLCETRILNHCVYASLALWKLGGPYPHQNLFID